MPKIDVCLTPDLLHLYKVKERIVVVVDILRATSCIVTGLASGVKSITPVATLQECKKLQQEGYIGAAERDGKTAEGFEMGNSPFSYMEEEVKGRRIALTTTNGTRAITESKPARKILIGSFLNLSALAAYLSRQGLDLLIVCAGWKGRVNLEDSLFAGSLAEALKDDFTHEDDSVLACRHLFEAGRNNLFHFLEHSSHFNRLIRLNVKRDIEFCLTLDQFDAVPVLRGDELVRMDLT